jgi:acetyl esterase/lipase
VWNGGRRRKALPVQQRVKLTRKKLVQNLLSRLKPNRSTDLFSHPPGQMLSMTGWRQGVLGREEAGCHVVERRIHGWVPVPTSMMDDLQPGRAPPLLRCLPPAFLHLAKVDRTRDASIPKRQAACESIGATTWGFLQQHQQQRWKETVRSPAVGWATWLRVAVGDGSECGGSSVGNMEHQVL